MIPCVLHFCWHQYSEYLEILLVRSTYQCSVPDLWSAKIFIDYWFQGSSQNKLHIGASSECWEYRCQSWLTVRCVTPLVLVTIWAGVPAPWLRHVLTQPWPHFTAGTHQLYSPRTWTVQESWEMQAFPSIIWSECISTLDPASRQNTKSYSYLFGLKSLKYPARKLAKITISLQTTLKTPKKDTYKFNLYCQLCFTALGWEQLWVSAQSMCVIQSPEHAS